MPANAAIYISDPSLLGSRLFDRIPDIESYEDLSDGTTATGVLLCFAWGQITMSFMPPGDIDEHLRGFSGYAEHIIKDRDVLLYTLSRIRYVRMSIGCVIQHAPEHTEDVHNFLFNFSSVLNGLLFLYDSIYDHNAKELGGPEANAA